MSYQHPPLHNIFVSVDADRSGKISADELQRALSNGTWNPFNPETCRLMISMFDSDRDGAINFNEFASLWEYINQWTQCFRSFDVDNSGNIDKRELSMALTKFGMFDSDRDGAINFNEFASLWEYINQWTQCFRSFDVDNSGNIDKRELSMALTKF
ncbi:unnamed protein product, partial [Gongylonema pulchrum]|uniref:EF-hand domain-containing protein n=1 Tax=Gongylonema pulchrum TaxID=637853 RepID=A0A183DR66_9BILA